MLWQTNNLRMLHNLRFFQLSLTRMSSPLMLPNCLNPFFALDIFICSFRKCIQHTTRGQSNFPLSKLWCCYIFIVLKYWWQNSITAHIYANCDQELVTRWVNKVQKEGKRSSEGLRGIIFLLYWPEHGCSSLTESSHALVSPRCGSTPPIQFSSSQC